MQWCTESRRGGFVLMEAVIALAIIAVIAIALLGATAAQVRTADKGTLLLVAQSLAEERMATMRALGWAELNAVPDSLLAGTFPPPFDEYAWRTEVVRLTEEHELFSVGVEVTVAGEAFSMSTLLHEPESPAAPGAGQAPTMGPGGPGSPGGPGGPGMGTPPPPPPQPPRRQ
jgi:type II secretory pathway pseudopilin PulG